MGAFRYAQSFNAGVLPTKNMKNTFLAQAFDAGDPCSGGNQCCTNKKDGQGGWPCDAGVAPHTGQFMVCITVFLVPLLLKNDCNPVQSFYCLRSNYFL
jgi:hypothetical protein